jgi:hypothetical protein
MDEQGRGWTGDGREQARLPGSGAPSESARKTWVAFAVLGVVVTILVAVLNTVSPGYLIVLLPAGAALGGFVGFWVQLVGQAWLGNPPAATPANLDAGRAGLIQAQLQAARAAADAAATRAPEHGLQPTSRWARAYLACVRSVAAYHAVVGEVPAGTGRDWLADIGTTLDRELAEALRLARLGESLAPEGPGGPSETARRVLERLRAAKKSFAETTDRAVAIALDLRAESDFIRVRAQLDLLAEQAPNLRDTSV